MTHWRDSQESDFSGGPSQGQDTNHHSAKGQRNNTPLIVGLVLGTVLGFVGAVILVEGQANDYVIEQRNTLEKKIDNLNISVGKLSKKAEALSAELEEKVQELKQTSDRSRTLQRRITGLQSVYSKIPKRCRLYIVSGNGGELTRKQRQSCDEDRDKYLSDILTILEHTQN